MEAIKKNMEAITGKLKSLKFIVWVSIVSVPQISQAGLSNESLG